MSWSAPCAAVLIARVASCDESVSSGVTLATWWMKVRDVVDVYSDSSVFEAIWLARPHFHRVKEQLKAAAGPDGTELGNNNRSRPRGRKS